MLLFTIRYFVFNMYESPKYLMGRGRDAEAVEIVHAVAQYNGKKSTLTLEMLKEVENLAADRYGAGYEKKTAVRCRRACMLCDMCHECDGPGSRCG